MRRECSGLWRLVVMALGFAAAWLPGTANAQTAPGAKTAPATAPVQSSGLSRPEPSASPQQTPTETTVDASRGGITISSGVNSLTIGARAQFRWTVDDREQFDGDLTGSGVGREDGVQSQFDVPRLRVTLAGGAFKPWLRYSFQFDFSRTPGEGASKIKDAIIEIRPVGRNYRVSLGQFKAPFGLQQITSSGRLLFVDRAITDAKFSPSRDMGVMFSGTAASRKVGYDVGVFNGSGESIRQNNESHLWAGRIYFNPLGPYALSEGASDAGPKPVLHLGLGARGGKQIRGRATAGVVEDVDNQTAWNVEFAYKAPRFYSTAEFFRMTDEQNNPVSRPDLDSTGYHVQAGFMVIPKKIELGILWAQVDGDTREEDTGLSELRAGAGYYWQSHALKLQADIGQLSYESGFSSLTSRARQGLPVLGPRVVSGRSLADTQLRVQLQLAF